MAGDWLKVEKDTPEKPEILVVASRLGLSIADVFLACFRVWRWADSVTPDGAVRSVDPASLDALVHTPGLTQALIDVGWLQVRQGSLVVPNFNRHMGQSAKRRCQDSVRKMSAREADKMRTREEKSIEQREVARDPPTVEEVRAYVAKRTVKIDPELFVAHYAANGWKRDSGIPILDWKMVLREWEIRETSRREPVKRPRPEPPDREREHQLRETERQKRDIEERSKL